MAFVSGGSTSGTSGGGPTAAALLSAVEQHAAAQQDGRTTTPSMQTLAGERFIQQQQQSATAAVTAGHANPAAAQLNNFAGNAALLAAAQGQLALSQLLLNPLGAAAAQLLNPQALALYYAQLSALLQPGAVQAAIAAAAAGSQQQQQQAPTVSVAHPTATIAQRTPDALLLEQAAAQVQAAHASRINLTATRSVEQRQLNLTAASPESVKDHISRLISENEAILEPNPMLLKRRPYHRQTVGAQNSIDLSDSGGSQRGSPGPSSACLSRENSRPTLNVTQPSPVVRSVFEPFPSIAAANQLMRGGSLTSGQPIVRPEAVKCFQCNYCHVKFSNETALEAHEFRCSRRTSEVAAVSRPDIVNSPIRKQVSSPAGGLENRHPLKKRLLAAATKEEPAKVPKLEPSASASSQQLSGIEHLIAAAAASHNNDQHRVLTRIAADLVQQRILAAEQQAIVATPVQQVQAPVPVEPVATRLVGIDKPYTLMLPVTRPDPALPKTRNRPRHITSETFVCFNRTQPMFVEQKPRLSMYSNWQQLPINPLDAKLNLLYMSTCATRPRVGAKPYWRYTNANKEGQLRMTHSSYWELGHKLRQQLQQQQQATESLQPIVVPSAILPASVSFPQQRSRSPTSSTSSSITVSPPPPPPPAPTAQSLTSLPPPTMMIPKPTITIPKPIVVIKENVVGTSNSAIRTSSSHSKRPLATANRQVGGIRTDEVEVYVRGRGRGRYECERCGIKCKKPSMLKKHLKSHTDIRPFKCTQCNFSFKTKGNLTKHTQSKAHQRRKVEQPIGGEIDSDSDNDRLEIASPAPSDETNSIDSDDECSSENEEDSREEVFYNEDIPYRKFGQEHSLIERSTHTPPTLWIVGPTEEGWPIAGRDQRCHSAPPASNSSPEVSRKRKRRVKQLQQQQEDEAVQQRETAMEVDESIESSRNASSLCNGNIRGIKIEPNSISPPTVNNHRIGVFLAKEELACDLCNEVFRKASELQLHRQTHIIAQQNNARRGGFQCNVCKKSFRSKPLLHKHMEMDHSDYGTQMTTGEQDSDGDDSSTFFVKNGGSSSSSNPRSFVCTDCGVGFRKHGVLAKHLRSKMHVLQLDKLGKLPEDALTLITKKENGACLNEVDTSDCERARASLIRIVSGLRGGGENFSSLECREQLTASPVPVVALPLIASSPVQTSPSSSSASRKRCESMSVKHFQMQSTVEKQRRRAESMSIVKPTPAVTMATGKQMTNTVWMPPKIDQLDRRPIFDVTQGARLLLDAAAQAENNTRCRSEEAASDSTGARSETSTPVLRNGLTTLSSAPSPAAVISNATKCYFCEVQFDSPSELRVHQHTDHVVMRDGNDFKCPRRSCDKVYPNRDNLRLHIAAHYRGGRITPINDGRDEETTALLTATDQINNSTAAAVALHRKLTGSISSQHAPSAPNHSPGVPEESQTNNHRLKQLNHSPLSAASSESPLSATPPSRESANHSVTVMPMDTIAGVKMQHLMNGMAERDHYLATCWLQMQQQQQQQQQALTSSQSIPSPTTSSPVSTPPPTTRLPCSICGACFQDAIQLQQHWLSHVCDRPHVCRQCDAGFTTADALSVHSATHHATPVQSS